MKKVLKMENLDCANCAAQMETAIAKLDGVSACSISFMTQRMTLQAAKDRFDQIVQEAQKICKKIEPDCEIIV